ncbi:Fc.00g027540.m01.CDS01 [Cosmosporella sp. VM-42]
MPFLPDNPAGSYPIKGIALKDGELPGIRKELREFKKDTYAWNLYMLGLWQFQLVPQDKQLSYFQIAGIHGLPYEAWPANDEKLKSLKTKPDTGFCTHTSILFLSWHRPYLALFESTLRDAMLYVAKQFTVEENQGEYMKAAETFRIPFWDWALPQTQDTPIFPNEATDSDEVEVTMPESLRKESELEKNDNGFVKIPNPLYAYQFQSGTAENIKIDNLSTTTRYHAKGEHSSPKEQQEFLSGKIFSYTKNGVPGEVNLRERVVYLLKSYERFDQVSHNRWDPEQVPKPDEEDKVPGLGFGSIEDIHNNVHILVGGNGEDDNGKKRSGHMGGVPVSAFDPIFWLHHTNIDRLVSIWQDLRNNPTNQNSWVTTKPGRHSWVTATGADEGLHTPLAPFYKDEDNFWDSDDVRKTRTFGYAYPETKSWNFSNPADYRADIERQLNNLYPSGSLATMIVANKEGDDKPEALLRTRAKKLSQVKAVAPPSTAITALSLIQADSATESNLPIDLAPINVPNIEVPNDRSLTNLAKDGTYLEWLLNIKAQKHALGGEYLVHVFLGTVPPEESTILYPVSPYHVGTFAPLGQSEATACGKCQRDQAAGTEITGQIPLTISLAERYFAGWLPSLSEVDVIKYLQENLHWEVVNDRGERLMGHRDSVDGLLVGVISNEVTLPKDGYEFPRYSPYIKIYPEATTKQDGRTGRAEGTGITNDNKYFDLPVDNN